MHDDKNSEAQQWELIEEHFRNGKLFMGKVVEATPKRITVDIGGIQGFVEQPSYYYYAPYTVEEQQISPEERFKHHLEQLRGKEMQLKVTEVDRTRNHLILSQQLYTEEEREAMRIHREHVLRELQPGDIRRGVVTSLTHVRVFVDVEGIEGWIPRHFLSLQNHRIDPHDVLHIGQEIEVMVLENDRQRVTL
jgi:small subunit ribosomal protein S1